MGKFKRISLNIPFSSTKAHAAKRSDTDGTVGVTVLIHGDRHEDEVKCLTNS